MSITARSMPRVRVADCAAYRGSPRQHAADRGGEPAAIAVRDRRTTCLHGSGVSGHVSAKRHTIELIITASPGNRCVQRGALAQGPRRCGSGRETRPGMLPANDVGAMPTDAAGDDRATYVVESGDWSARTRACEAGLWHIAKHGAPACSRCVPHVFRGCSACVPHVVRVSRFASSRTGYLMMIVST